VEKLQGGLQTKNPSVLQKIETVTGRQVSKHTKVNENMYIPPP
jgi:hypothetical protein